MHVKEYTIFVYSFDNELTKQGKLAYQTVSATMACQRRIKALLLNPMQRFTVLF